MKLARKLGLTVSLPVFAVLIGSCGQKGNTDLGIEVNPGTVFIVAGSESNCTDRTEAEATGFPAGKSVIGPRVRFNNIKLQWKSTTDLLYITNIRVTASVGNEVLDKFLEGAEIEALFGFAGGIIPKCVTSTTVPECPTYSSDSTKKTKPYMPCGLNVGGLSFAAATGGGTDGAAPGGGANTTPRSFTANMRIEILGYSENPTTGTQTPVRQFVIATARSQ